jgi:hypothetical protein
MRTEALWIPASVTGMACFHSYTLVTHYNFFTLIVLFLIEIIFNQVYLGLLRLWLPFCYGLSQVFYCS